jgi:hypothetical protein
MLTVEMRAVRRIVTQWRKLSLAGKGYVLAFLSKELVLEQSRIMGTEDGKEEESRTDA